MSAMASQITSLTIVYSTVYSDPNQRKHQSPASPAFVRGFTGDWWISRSNGQLRGKCFHLMTSSWNFHTWHTNACLAIHPRNRLPFLFPSQSHQQLCGFREHSLYSMQYWGISVTLCKGPYSLASQECIYRSSTKVYVDVCPVADWSHPFLDWFLCDHHCCEVNHLLAVAYHGPPWTLQNMGVMTTLSNGNLFCVTGP